VAGVLVGGGDQRIGADCVVSGLSGRELIELSDGRGVPASEASRPEPLPEEGRFVVSCVVASAGLPEPLAREAFVPADPETQAPALHLQRLAATGAGDELLVLEALCPLSSGRRLAQLRPSMLAALRRQLPFLDRHLRIVDCPHDGLPLQVFREGRETLVERSVADGPSARAELPERRWRAGEPGFLGGAGGPARGPVRGSCLVGKTVVPGLGREGELLAAWSVARQITHTDRAWQKRRRQMWTKMDTD
jgi:hypothetical protein